MAPRDKKMLDFFSSRGAYFDAIKLGKNVSNIFNFLPKEPNYTKICYIDVKWKTKLFC